MSRAVEVLYWDWRIPGNVAVLWELVLIADKNTELSCVSQHGLRCGTFPDHEFGGLF
jgi:hypothetical protein